MNNLNYNEVKKLDESFCIQNYNRFPIVFTQGKGSLLYDDQGKEYLDFGSGIGVNSIGYCHPHWVEAVSKQAGKLAHVSNLYYTKEYAVLAKRLTEAAGMSRGFFCNSGAEANEAAIKLARKYSRDKYGDGRSTIVTLKNSFHGRSLATIKATGQPDYHVDFAPYPEGFVYLDANDIDGLQTVINDEVCGIMVEGILGEGGVIPLSDAFIKAIETIAKKKDILLIFDEIQTGLGRTGHLFSYMGFEVSPDVVTVAKGLGGGLPIGGLLVSEKCAAVLGPGTHGSTFGGNPIACAGANAVLDIVLEESFLEDVRIKGNALIEGVENLNNPIFGAVRGKGLMVGIEIKEMEARDLVSILLEKGLVALSAGGNTLRLLPPLTITIEELKKGLTILESL